MEFDVVIVGGGIVGLSLATALAAADDSQAENSFSVAVVERSELQAPTDAPDCRVSAINRFALQRFQRAGVFDDEPESGLSGRICPFEKMFVWEHAGAGQIRFDSAELGVTELGAIVENRVLQQLLLARVKAADNITLFCPQEIAAIKYETEDESTSNTVVELVSGEKLQCHLLVGADGVNSRVRQVAAIQHVSQSYQQQGLVCNVSTSESHQNTAWQCFLPTGPLAFLPLYNAQSSIVWSLDDAAAQQVMALDDAAFMRELAEASEFRMGEILETSPRYLFPLSHGHVEEYVKPGLALIGDAAHNIHPLAGQGANLGIADAFVLAEVIRHARQANRQWAALHTLKKYQRQRKGANRVMELSMTGFKELFGNENALLSELRNAGLSLVDHIPPLKYRIIQQALGLQTGSE